ncbi:hypothetical protein EVAR_36217_1 [Eumeta japonica]|uniref:Uncharacterized protein n=1 Tax=Eumeta variegata TaxID=151549 RepID=A0A4C1VTD4_EUMVA|nr:hypothetical protein EVAR_36217_1 [Eumeta japonica]
MNTHNWRGGGAGAAPGTDRCERCQRKSFHSLLPGRGIIPVFNSRPPAPRAARADRPLSECPIMFTTYFSKLERCYDAESRQGSENDVWECRLQIIIRLKKAVTGNNEATRREAVQRLGAKRKARKNPLPAFSD